MQQFELLRRLLFYNWQNPEDTRTFNHAIGLPQKYIAIHPRCHKLITALRTAVENGEGSQIRMQHHSMT
jgi:hypothetical protein